MTAPPNSALQRTAIAIKCSAAGGQAPSAHERWRARVLRGRRAVAELSSYAHGSLRAFARRRRGQGSRFQGYDQTVATGACGCGSLIRAHSDFPLSE